MRKWAFKWGETHSCGLALFVGTLWAIGLLTGCEKRGDYIYVQYRSPDGTNSYWLPKNKLTETGMDDSLPVSTNSLPPAAPVDPSSYDIVVELTGHAVSIDGKPVSEPELTERLRQCVARNANTRVLVLDAPTGGYKDLKALMKLMSAAAVKDVTFTVKRP